MAASVASPWRCLVAMSLPRRLASVMTEMADSSSRMLPVLADNTSRILSSISFSCRLFSVRAKAGQKDGDCMRHFMGQAWQKPNMQKL